MRASTPRNTEAIVRCTFTRVHFIGRLSFH
jgi:hypothetical protein